jgi:CubicO group peptidase (beta-lactamase class C family)
MKSWHKVREYLVKGVEQGVFPGADLKVLKDGEIVFEFSTGFASLIPEKRGLQKGTIFDVASLTKVVVTTSAVMLLVQEEKLNLDDMLGVFFPECKSRDKKNITIRQILSHSAGFISWSPIFREVEEEEARTGVKIMGTALAKNFFLKSILKKPLVCEPGTSGIYSDLGFILLGLIIERITGESLDRFAQKRIFEKLGMQTSFYIKNNKLKKDVHIASTEYCPWRGRVIHGEVHDENAWALGGVAGHAGLFTSTEDISIFARELINAYYHKGELFSQEVARTFFKKQEIPSSSFALGWDTPTPGVSTSGRYFSIESIGHTGFTGVSLWIDIPRRIAVVFFTNRIHPDRKNDKIKSFRPALHDLIMEELGYGN